MANVRNILLKITGDGSDARRTLDEARQNLHRLANEQAEARISIKADAFNAQLDRAREQLARLSAQEATPQVKIKMGQTLLQIERLEAKLRELGRKDVNIDVDVKRGAFETALSGVSTLFSSVGDGARFAGQGVLTMVSSLTALGPLSAGALVALAALLPVVILLGSSLLSAAAGVGFLAVALAGALGPAVLVAVAALARFAQILLAIKERHDQASSQAASVANAQDAVTSATENLANAQQNLRQQTTAAWQAYHDAIEQVKDDLLSVQQAELGIDQANLNLRKAKEELRDFQKGAGAAGDAVAGVVKKFTDVNVDFDTKAFSKAFDGAGVGGDDQLKLEQLILNVRSAALSEKQATDTLSDAKRKLNRDRRTEADFLQRGIKAHEGYRTAVRQVASAQRALDGASRQANEAIKRQGRLWDDLSPDERRFARRFERFATAIRQAFGPATRRVLKGFGDALDTVAEALQDEKVQRALARIGGAIGDFFRSFARQVASKSFRNSFAEFADGAARLIRILGGRGLKTALNLFTEIGKTALPTLIRGAKRAVGLFEDLFGKATNNNPPGPTMPAPLSGTIQGAQRQSNNLPLISEHIPTKTPLDRFFDRTMDSLREWRKIIRGLSGIFHAFLKASKDEGDKLAGSLGDALLNLSKMLNSDEGQQKLKDFFQAVRRLVSRIAEIIDSIYEKTKSTGDLLNGKGWKGFLFSRTPIGMGIDIAKGILGGKAGGGLVPGPGGSGDNVLASVAGGALQPLEGGEFVIRRAVVQALGVPALSRLNAGDLGGFQAAAAGGPVHHHSHTNQFNVPGNQTMDPTAAAVIFGRELERRGG